MPERRRHYPLVFKSVSATTSTGAGATIVYDTPMAEFMLQMVGGVASTSSSGDTVTLYGSLDGTNFYSLIGPVTGYGYTASTTGLMAVYAYAEVTTHGSTLPLSVYIAAR